ncbi:tRNA-uridine aminocarboxypropyltransferase [Paraferrimonas sedimenticola]|uniref:tRNA-uridine aminocarboxypropyltransferase n=1 Tax=Paraferrimonas sedimenticola TaxID=375674 RepID=A0AA37RWX8_9GAMM|nr:tRNA-uridine aminocarboxypropyltransferase [Paraferrimonas sedimenticola]GLP96813.1 DTW domain-containing protein [Paraferrimonas sedimenticola]
MPQSQHAVHRLFQARLARATRPFNARGGSVQRCPQCRIHQDYCMCDYRISIDTQAAVLLCMFDDEVLKPTNTGRLIADLIPDTHAYIWSRTGDNREMKDLLADPQYQPYLVFPGHYAGPERVVTKPNTKAGKRPLFVLLDGAWREAAKMFRKSPWLDHLPVLSIEPEVLSRYALRKASHDSQLATAEVAARILEVMGERDNADTLDTWFELFNERYRLGSQQFHGEGVTKAGLLEQPALAKWLQNQVAAKVK